MPKSKKSSWGGKRVGAGRKPTSELAGLKQRLTPTAFAAYEGTIRTPQSRSWIYMPTINPRKELSGYDRVELLRKGHWMYNNIGFVARAIDAVGRYASPLKPQANTSNREWNKKADQLFHDACCTAPFGFDASGEVNFMEAQSHIIRQVALDGDYFFQKILSRNGRGMVRFIGGECIGTTTYLPDLTQTKGWVDGCLPDEFGRPIAWNVIDPNDVTKAQIVSADELHQIKRQYRKGYLRAPSWLSRAINHITDISEILAYEKQSFKLNSQVAFVITSPEAGSIGIGSKRVKQDLNDLGNISVDNLYNSSGIPQLKPGEDIKSFANDHPNSNFETFLNYLMRDIAWGMGIAPELLWDISSAGGANTRYLLEDANQFFAEIQSVTREQFCRPFWTFWIWNEIESGRLEHPGDDWWRVHFIAPKPPSVDLGREGKLYIDLVNSGLMSRKRYFGMLGLDADDEIDDLIADAVAIKEKCEKAGIKKTDIIPPAPGSNVPPEYEDSDGDDDSPGETEEGETPMPNLTGGKQA